MRRLTMIMSGDDMAEKSLAMMMMTMTVLMMMITMARLIIIMTMTRAMMMMTMTGGSGTLGGCSLDWFTEQRMHPISETCFDIMMLAMMMMMIQLWFTKQMTHLILKPALT